jgi:flagellar basal body-associated protein FliL
MNSVLEGLIPLVAIIFTFGIPGVIIFWWLYTKHRERMRLIEKGLSPEEVKAYFADVNQKPVNKYSSLKWGILLTFLGIGIFAANLLEEFYDIEEGVMMGMIIFCAGVGLLVYFSIVSAKTKETPTEVR